MKPSQEAKDYEKTMDFDNSSVDIEQFMGSDSKINPDFYIHNAIVKAQNSFDNVSFKEGLERYQIFINQLELISRACGRLVDYEQKLKEFKDTDAFQRIDDEVVRKIKLSEKKFELILSEINQNKLATEPLII